MKMYKFLLPVSLLLFISCSKKDSSTTDISTETNSCKETAVVESSLNDALTTAIDLNDGAEDNGGVFKSSATGRIETCATISHDAAAKKVTIDFGTTPCNGADGHTRSGKIIITYVGLRDLSTSRTIQFLNYRRDSIKLNGTLSMSGITRSGATTTFNLQVTAGSFTIDFDNSGTFTLTSFDRTYSIDAGSLPSLSDNVTTITGNIFIGVNRSGKTFSVEIHDPIVFKGSCAQSGIYYPVAGVHIITLSGVPIYTINWGSGVCDRVFNLSIRGQLITSTLP